MQAHKGETASLEIWQANGLIRFHAPCCTELHMSLYKIHCTMLHG